MRGVLQRRVVFFGGKGGVGKTTCAAAASLEAARLGRRVLLISVDPAHSIADVFERRIGEGPTPVVPGVMARELDPHVEVDRYLASVRDQVSRLFAPAVVKQAFRQFEQAAFAPGIEDIAVFDRVMAFVLDPSPDHDLLIVDTAPLGHALRMLSMPLALGEWLDALALRRLDVVTDTDRTPGAAEADRIVQSLRQRALRVKAFHGCLTDPATTGFALVLTPERLPVEETKRAVDALEQLGVGVPLVVVNRVLPPAEGDYHEARVRQQQVYLREIDARFSAYPRVPILQLESDVHGLAALERVRAQLFGTVAEGRAD